MLMTFIIVGKKGGEIISRMGGNIIADFTQSNLATDVSAIFNLALTNYFTNKYIIKAERYSFSRKIKYKIMEGCYE